MKSILKFGLILAVFLVGLFVAGIAAAEDQGSDPDVAQVDCELKDYVEEAAVASSTTEKGIVLPPIVPLCDKMPEGILLTGESVKLCGPDGNFNYQWSTFINGFMIPDGTSKCMVLTVPYGTLPESTIGAKLTVTSKDYLKCMDTTCIKYIVKRTPCCPNLDDFCEGKATSANAAKFVYSGLPAGYTYEWWINGAKVANPNEAYLDGLHHGLYGATIKIFHNGNFVKFVCGQGFYVSENPVATITPTPITA
jgi:hypothetical protein